MHSKEKEVIISQVLESAAAKKKICIPIRNRKLGVVSKNQSIY